MSGATWSANFSIAVLRHSMLNSTSSEPTRSTYQPTLGAMTMPSTSPAASRITSSRIDASWITP